MRYIAFDVETPNYRNDRMSAIGVAVIEDGQIVRTLSTYVNPECEFSPFHMELTGITPEMVVDAPNFAQLWTLLEPILSDGILLAHNAPFDMGVLAKCLRAYGIVWRDTARYACTCRMARACFPQLPNHRLNTVSDYLQISLDHHQADSDTNACAEIFLACVRRGLSPARFYRTYDLREQRTIYRR